MWIPARSRRLVYAWLVNCVPWSVLKISRRRWISAVSNAASQKVVSSVLDSSQASTKRLYQSRIATFVKPMAFPCAGHTPLRLSTPALALFRILAHTKTPDRL